MAHKTTATMRFPKGKSLLAFSPFTLAAPHLGHIRFGVVEALGSKRIGYVTLGLSLIPVVAKISP